MMIVYGGRCLMIVVFGIGVVIFGLLLVGCLDVVFCICIVGSIGNGG